jgi:hypothetical protein
VVESSPQLQATNPTNGTHNNENQQNNKDFQFKVIIENPIVKKMEQMQVLQRSTRSGDLQEY